MSQNAPHFTVIIPAHDRVNALADTLASVAAQTFADFECLVIDDASKDGAAIQALVEGRGDPRFRYHRRARNGGGGAARNTGIELARGPFVAFLDSDDLFMPEKLATLAQSLTDAPMVIWYSRASVDRGRDRRWIRPDRAIGSTEDVGEYLFFANQFIPTSTMAMRIKTARKIGFDPDLRKGQDLDFCIRAAHMGARFSMIDAPLTVWCDAREAGRTSRVSGSAQPRAWLNASRHMLTPRAIAGFKSNVLAYHLAPESRRAAFACLVQGLLAGVPLRVVARQALRCFMPRSAYRGLVDRFVGLFGAPPLANNRADRSASKSA